MQRREGTCSAKPPQLSGKTQASMCINTNTHIHECTDVGGQGIGGTSKHLSAFRRLPPAQDEELTETQRGRERRIKDFDGERRETV